MIATLVYCIAAVLGPVKIAPTAVVAEIPRSHSAQAIPSSAQMRVAQASASAASATRPNKTLTDLPPRRLRFVVPKLPEDVPRQGDKRWVEISYTVSATGEVQDAVVADAYPDNLTNEAALTAVRQWRFEPATKDGKPVATQTKIRLRFY